MKIALVQINPIIGDFTRNCEKIVGWAEQARQQGVSLAIFPELVVCGYPPQDLLERQSFLDAHDQAVSTLLARLPEGLDVMFGCLERQTGQKGKPLYNAAVVARQGKIVYRARKQLLPSYDVFDETRYFEPGEPSGLYELHGMTFGVTVCEDVWSDEVREYQVEPVADIMATAAVKGQTVDALINISASPFQRDKENLRKGIFAKICRYHKVPFLYCNQVGGQDSLLFDGRSLVMDGNGLIVAQAHGFREDMIIVDSSGWLGEIHGEPQLSEQEAVYRGLVMGVTDYVRKCGFSSAVLGLSGGIDSALTAAIAVEALGPDNVLGVALPSPYSSPDSLEDAQAACR